MMSFQIFNPKNGSLNGSGSVEDHAPTNTSGVLFKQELYSDFDDYKLGTKLAFVTVGCVVTAINILAIATLRRSRKIPYASKFLCTGILSYDLCFIIISTVRKFIPDPPTNLAFQVVGSLSYHLSLTSVMLMSAERYLLFYYPMRYLKIMTEKLTHVLAFSTWSIYVLSFAIVRYGVCYIELKSVDVFKQAGVCNNILVIHLGICLFIITTISCICNWKVLTLIKSKRDRPKSANTLPTNEAIRCYKSTGLVLTHVILILLTSIVYGMILVAVRFYNLGVLQLRISFESVSFINCSLDPILYIVWFRECQMHILKFMAFFSKRFNYTAEEMRIEIFDIVTSESFHRRNSKEV